MADAPKKDLTSVIELSKNWTPPAHGDDASAPVMEEKPIEKVDAFESLDEYAANTPMPEPPPDPPPDAPDPSLLDAPHDAGSPPPPPPPDEPPPPEGTDPFAPSTQASVASPLDGLSGVAFNPEPEGLAPAPPVDGLPPADDFSPPDPAPDPAMEMPDAGAAPEEAPPLPAAAGASSPFTVVPDSPALIVTPLPSEQPPDEPHVTPTGVLGHEPTHGHEPSLGGMGGGEPSQSHMEPSMGIVAPPTHTGLTGSMAPPGTQSIPVPEPMPEPDRLARARTTSAAVSSAMQQVQKAARSLPVGKPAVAAAYPFSLLITGRLSDLDRAKLLDLLSTHQMGFNDRDLEPQFMAGRVLLPRISEYAGILLIQALRDAAVVMQFGPSDSIFASEATADTEADLPAGDAEMLSRTYTDISRGDADQIPVTTGDQIPGWDHWQVVDTLATSAALTIQQVEARRSSEYTDTLEALVRELKFRAARRRVHGLTQLKIQLDTLGLPTQYRLTVSAQAVVRTTGWVMPEALDQPPVVDDQMVEELLDPQHSHARSGGTATHSTGGAGAPPASMPPPPAAAAAPPPPPPPPPPPAALAEAAAKVPFPTFHLTPPDVTAPVQSTRTAILPPDGPPDPLAPMLEDPMAAGPIASMDTLLDAEPDLSVEPMAFPTGDDHEPSSFLDTAASAPPVPKRPAGTDALRAQASETVPKGDPPLIKPARPEPPMAIADSTVDEVLKAAESSYRELKRFAEEHGHSIPGTAVGAEEITGSLVEPPDPQAYNPEYEPPDPDRDPKAITPELPTLGHGEANRVPHRNDSVVPPAPPKGGTNPSIHQEKTQDTIVRPPPFRPPGRS
ncbi:MAG TPA: hypothetical protein VL588_00170 [Bdellovibrionota bacterium]|jgi:hypothetical protein|nr:hypothetical protein [Bdellovibrionota bacterium]